VLVATQPADKLFEFKLHENGLR